MNRTKIFIIVGSIFALVLGVWMYARSSNQLIAISSHNRTPEVVASRSPREYRLLFVGDIMLDRKVGAIIRQKGDWRFPFLRTADRLKAADLTFGNLEGPVSARGIKVGSIYSFRFDPRVLEGLTHAGFDVVSIANNHMWDYGRDAFLDTLSLTKAAGIEPVGGGLNFDEAHTAVTKQVGDTKVGYLAYTDLISSQVSATATQAGISFLNRQQMVQDIQKAKLSHDIVIVSFHLGDEYQTVHNGKQEIIFREAIDAGATLVIGHHPHVVQEVEQYKDGWIAYSLGNFVFDQTFSAETMRGLMLEAVVRDGEVVEVISVPVRISSDLQPYIE